jgi:ABC-type bacteriocin/lantibiotic exporter with double-glycine peptidase domain
LGSIKDLPWQLNQVHAVYIFIGLSLGYGLLSIIIGLAGPKISMDSAEAISKKVCEELVKTRMSWFEGKDVSDIASRINIVSNV